MERMPSPASAIPAATWYSSSSATAHASFTSLAFDDGAAAGADALATRGAAESLGTARVITGVSTSSDDGVDAASGIGSALSLVGALDGNTGAPTRATTASCRLDHIVTANAAPPSKSAISSVRRYVGPLASVRVRGCRSSLDFNS